MSSSEEPQRPIKTAPKRKSVKAEDGAAADDGPPAKIARVKTTKNLGTPKRVEKDEMDRMKFKLVKAILDLGTLDKVKLVEMSGMTRQQVENAVKKRGRSNVYTAILQQWGGNAPRSEMKEAICAFHCGRKD